MSKAHREHRSAIHFWIWAPVAVIVVVLLFSCKTPKYGCPANSGKHFKSGY